MKNRCSLLNLTAFLTRIEVTRRAGGVELATAGSCSRKIFIFHGVGVQSISIDFLCLERNENFEVQVLEVIVLIDIVSMAFLYEASYVHLVCIYCLYLILGFHQGSLIVSKLKYMFVNILHLFCLFDLFDIFNYVSNILSFFKKKGVAKTRNTTH